MHRERHHAAVKQVGAGDGCRVGIELVEGHLAVRIDEVLLVDAPHALHRADIEVDVAEPFSVRVTSTSRQPKS